MDDGALFRFPPPKRRRRTGRSLVPVLDWSAWDVQNDPRTEAISAPGPAAIRPSGFASGRDVQQQRPLRKFDAGTMCPSFRVTRDEQHLTRGRANTLRLALSGQLLPSLSEGGAGGGSSPGDRMIEDSFTSEAVRDALDLCVSCKGCKRECPTGVDMARMKIEFLHHYKKRHGYTLKDRLIAHLPDYAHAASRVPWLANLRDRIPGAPALGERLLGLSARRRLPTWRRDTFWRARDRSLFASAEATIAAARRRQAASSRRHLRPGLVRAERDRRGAR